MFVRNFRSLTLSLPCSSYVPSSTYVRFSELTSPLLSKNVPDVYKFSKEKSGSKKREKNQFVCKRKINDQCFLHSNIYSNNKNVYEFIKKTLNELYIYMYIYIYIYICLFNQKRPFHAGLSSKQQNVQQLLSNLSERTLVCYFKNQAIFQA